MVDKNKRREFFKGPWVRIKRSLKADDHEQIINGIRDDALNLQRIVQSALKLKDPRQTRQGRCKNMSWMKAREHSLRLHDVLRSRWASLCDSHAHSIWVRFKPPSKRSANYEAQERLSCSFALSCAATSRDGVPWAWRDVQILPSYPQSWYVYRCSSSCRTSLC
jgi:hypothetical protein